MTLDRREVRPLRRYSSTSPMARKPPIYSQSTALVGSLWRTGTQRTLDPPFAGSNPARPANLANSDMALVMCRFITRLSFLTPELTPTALAGGCHHCALGAIPDVMNRLVCAAIARHDQDRRTAGSQRTCSSPPAWAEVEFCSLEASSPQRYRSLSGSARSSGWAIDLHTVARYCLRHLTRSIAKGLSWPLPLEMDGRQYSSAAWPSALKLLPATASVLAH
jgi:hypothetical protein